jgi:hypothetical protein
VGKTAICTITIWRDDGTNPRIPLPETAQNRAQNRIDTGDFAVRRSRVHNFRVTPLCTACTRLRNKKLQTHVFR